MNRYMATTLQDLRDIFYSILREEENSSAYALNIVDLFLNSAQQRICLWTVINPLTKEAVRKWRLPFAVSEQFYTTVGYTTNTTAMTMSDTSILVNDTSNFSTSGALYVNGNIVSYTNKTATSFTGVSSISFEHPVGISIYQAYALPTDYASAINLIYDHKYQVDSILYDDVFQDLKGRKGTDYRRNQARGAFSEPYQHQPFYAIKDDTYLILFNVTSNGYSLRLRYEQIPTTMTTVSDTSAISNDIYAKTTIPYLAVGEMLYNRGEEARAWEILNFAIWQIREMYTHYNNSSQEKLSGKQYKIAKWNINI